MSSFDVQQFDLYINNEHSAIVNIETDVAITSYINTEGVSETLFINQLEEIDGVI